MDSRAKNLCDDLNKINNWDFQWKMNFNPDPNKPAQKKKKKKKLFSQSSKISSPSIGI